MIKSKAHVISSSKRKVMQTKNKKTTTTKLSIRRPKKPKTAPKRGRWERSECIAFLQGFRSYGKGKWKQIAKMIPNR